MPGPSEFSILTHSGNGFAFRVEITAMRKCGKAFAAMRCIHPASAPFFAQ
jgi:hypothetical protein